MDIFDLWAGEAVAQEIRKLQAEGRLEDAGWVLLRIPILQALRESNVKIPESQLQSIANTSGGFYRDCGVDVTSRHDLLAVLMGCHMMVAIVVASHHSGTASRETTDQIHSTFALLVHTYQHLIPRWVREGSDPPK